MNAENIHAMVPDKVNEILFAESTRSSTRIRQGFLFGAAGGAVGSALTSLLHPALLSHASTIPLFVARSALMTGLHIGTFEEILSRGNGEGPVKYGGAISSGLLASLLFLPIDWANRYRFSHAGSSAFRLMVGSSVPATTMLLGYSHVVHLKWMLVDETLPKDNIATDAAAVVACSLVAGAALSYRAQDPSKLRYLLHSGRAALAYGLVFATIDELEKRFQTD